MMFLMPLKEKIIRFLFVLENKQELIELKRTLQSFLYKNDEEIELSFFEKPEIKEIL